MNLSTYSSSITCTQQVTWNFSVPVPMHILPNCAGCQRVVQDALKTAMLNAMNQLMTQVSPEQALCSRCNPKPTTPTGSTVVTAVNSSTANKRPISRVSDGTSLVPKQLVQIPAMSIDTLKG